MHDPAGDGETAEQQLGHEMESSQPPPLPSRDTAIETLRNLYSSADVILRALRTELILARNQQPESSTLGDSDELVDNSLLANLRGNSAISRAISRNEATFKDDLAVFIPPDAEFIVPSKVVDIILGQSDAEASHVAIVNAAVYKVNIGALVCLLRRSFLNAGSEDTSESIKLLDALFPVPYFVQSFARARSDPSHSALYQKSLELCIETRTLVSLFAMEQNPSAEDCQDVLDGVFYEERGADGDRTLRFWDSNEVMPEMATNAINERMEKIKQVCSKPNPVPDLWHEFSWERYIKAALRWIDCRNVELTAGIALNGGIEIIDDLPQILPLRAKKNAPRAGSKRQAKPSAFDSQPRAQQTQFDAQDQPPTQFDMMHSVLTLHNQSIAAQQKRGFDVESAYADESYQPEPKKRRRAPQRPDLNATQLSFDYAASPPTQKKAIKANLKQATPEEIAKMRRISEEVGTQHMRTQQQSRAQTQKARAATGRVAGAARSKWTTLETGALHEYIKQLGTSWAHIKSYDDAGARLLTARSQVDLKDKARNMKFDILKAGAPLPNNFENVPLAKAMREKLESMGRLAAPAAAGGASDLHIIAEGEPLPLPYGPSQTEEAEDEDDAFENNNLGQESY
jgi:hypothetical protein